MKVYKETIRKYYKYQYSNWTQPTLSANGIISGSSYACDRDSIVHGQESFQAFDGNDSTYWWSGAGFPHWITFYSPVPIKVTHMYMWSGSNYNTQGVLQGSNDNTTWTDLISWSNAGQTKDFDIPNSNYYQYYRCYVTNGTYTHTLINTITFTATQRTIAESNSSDYDFYEDIEVYKVPTETINLDYSPNPILINADGVVTSTDSNGWKIYPQSANAGEVVLMLNKTANTSYPRWQHSSPNVYAYFKTPQKGIITSYLTTQWCDDNATGRICNHWILTGYETEANMLALANGVVLDDNTWASASKGASKICTLNNNRAFQYYTIHMVSNFAGSSYCSMGNTKFYMKLAGNYTKTVFKAIGE